MQPDESLDEYVMKASLGWFIKTGIGYSDAGFVCCEWLKVKNFHLTVSGQWFERLRKLYANADPATAELVRRITFNHE